MNNFSQHEIAGIPLVWVLINLLMDSSQIIEVLKIQDACRLRRITWEYLCRPIDRGRRNDSCRTETPAMRRGKLAPICHRQKGKF